jgi:hypothetical protein
MASRSLGACVKEKTQLAPHCTLVAMVLLSLDTRPLSSLGSGLARLFRHPFPPFGNQADGTVNSSE